MKKMLKAWSIIAILFGAEQTMAQNTLIMPKSEPAAIEQLKSEAFVGKNIDYIPYASDLQINPVRKTDYRQRMSAQSPVVKLQPISSHPVLKSMVGKKSKTSKFGEDNTANLKIDTVLETDYWGIVADVSTGKNLLFTVEYEYSNVSVGYEYFLKGARYTFYNDQFKKEASFSIRTSDTTQRIDIMSQYSTDYFNSDRKREFIIQSHGFAGIGEGPSSCRDTVFIVNEDGQVLKRIGKTSWISLHFIPDGWAKRAVVMPTYYEPDTIRTASGAPALSASGKVLMDDTLRPSVFRAMDLIKDTLKPLHVFKIREELSAASEGPLGELFVIEGQYYYITALYEKPCFINMDSMLTDTNNRYNVVIYKAKDFTVEKSISLPMPGIKQNNLSFSVLNNFGKYMISRKLFNNDDKFEILYAMSRYDISCDCETLQFYLMDEDGEIIEELMDDVSGVMPLQAIPGYDEEFALFMGGGSAVSAIKMFDLPSMRENITFPAIHDNELLSTHVERVPTSDGGYEYVFGLGRAEETNNTTYGGIAHYDRNGKMVKRIRIDLGRDAQLFLPVIQSSALNPYMVVPDNQREYLFFYKKGASGGVKVQNGFGVANEEKILYSWESNETDGDMQTAGIKANDDETAISNLFVTFENIYGGLTHKFYKLPFEEVVLQGKGTAAEPYIITTPAELNEIRNHKNAHFVLGNDIDMAAYTGVAERGFAPVDEFTGTLDGRNHIIKNMMLAGDGMFERLDGATIKNVFIKNVSFTKEDLWTAGCLVSKTFKTNIQNCHIEANITTRSNEDVLGGLVGQATNDTRISQCSFNGRIYAPNMEEVGGIVGKITGKSVVSNSYTQGKIEAFKYAGGIAGKSINGGSVVNSYSEADIYTLYASGGVVGANSGGLIEKNYAIGKIMVGVPDASVKFDIGVAGGVVGETDLNEGSMVKFSYGLNDTIIAPQRYTRVAWTEYFENASSGEYGDFEDGEEGDPIVVEKKYAMDSNFALASMLLGVDKASLSVASGDSCKVNRWHGGTGSYELFNQAFYEQKTHWAFGADELHPWVMSGNRPHLWFEFVVRSIELSSVEKTIKKDSSFTLQTHIMPENARNKNVTWTSSNEAVATVSAAGVVKGLSAGEAVITATTQDGSYKATCKVTVMVPVKQVIFSKKEMSIGMGNQVMVHITVLPENATNKHVLLYSLNTAVLRASGNLIYGAAEGLAKLVAVSEDGGASDTCTVRVGIGAEEIVLSEDKIDLYLSGVKQFQLNAVVYPKNAINNELVWYSDDSTVCSVNNDGLVTGLSKGMARVWVTTTDESVKAFCKVTVNEGVSNEDLQQSAKVSAYMDKGRLMISSSVEMQAAWLYDLNGQCLWSKTGIRAAQTEAMVEDLPVGLYLVKAKLTNGQTVVVKVRR